MWGHNERLSLGETEESSQQKYNMDGSLKNQWELVWYNKIDSILGQREM